MKSAQFKNTNMTKYYILTQPTRVSDLAMDDIEGDDYSWRDKARKLQIRRWRKIKHQLT